VASDGKTSNTLVNSALWLCSQATDFPKNNILTLVLKKYLLSQQSSALNIFLYTSNDPWPFDKYQWISSIYSSDVYKNGGLISIGELMNGVQFSKQTSQVIPWIEDAFLILGDPACKYSVLGFGDNTTPKKLAEEDLNGKIDHKVSLQPNPTNSRLRIKWNGALNETYNIVVYDITGHLVSFVENIKNTTTYELDLNTQYSSGKYFIVIYNNTGFRVSSSFLVIK